jgi:hypothetical protein
MRREKRKTPSFHGLRRFAFGRDFCYNSRLPQRREKGLFFGQIELKSDQENACL